MPTIQDIKEALEAGDVKTAEEFIEAVEAQGGISGEERDLFADRLSALKAAKRENKSIAEVNAREVKTPDKDAAAKVEADSKAADRKTRAKVEDSEKVAGAKNVAGKAVENKNAPPAWQGPAGVNPRD